MIPKVYSDLENQINKIDAECTTKYETILKAIHHKKYQSLYECLDNIPKYDEGKVKTCIESTKKYEYNISENLKIHKEVLYDCINKNFNPPSEKPFKSGDSFSQQNYNKCFKEFELGVQKVMSNLEGILKK